MGRRIGPMLLGLAALALAMPAAAQDLSSFTTGPVFTDFGPVAKVEYDMPIPADAHFAVAFDVTEGAKGEDRSSGFATGARFINMLAANGVDAANIRVAIVVHGPALHDLVSDEARGAHKWGSRNPSGDMVRAVMAKGVQFIACGQSAAGSGIAKADLMPGVQLALSAMTAHAQLQQQGYTLNPF